MGFVAISMCRQENGPAHSVWEERKGAARVLPHRPRERRMRAGFEQRGGGGGVKRQGRCGGTVGVCAGEKAAPGGGGGECEGWGCAGRALQGGAWPGPRLRRAFPKHPPGGGGRGGWGADVCLRTAMNADQGKGAQTGGGLA